MPAMTTTISSKPPTAICSKHDPTRGWRCLGCGAATGFFFVETALFVDVFFEAGIVIRSRTSTKPLLAESAFQVRSSPVRHAVPPVA